LAACINFPLWRAAAIGQSGFSIEGSTVFERYWKALSPSTMPYRGVMAVMLGMTWARGAIFYGSDKGKEYLLERGWTAPLAQTLPPLVCSTLVQFINMPIVRSSVTIQDPKSKYTSVTEAMMGIYERKGASGLWHGLTAGILKTVPKYITAVVVKDYMEANLPPVDPENEHAILVRSAVKSSAAGLAGAALTNPLDVIRNEMFKTDLGLSAADRKLMTESGWAFMLRGMAPNCTAVAIPIAITIFFTDVLERYI
jgi:hypothetical protein